jgi:hypothetical protein
MMADKTVNEKISSLKFERNGAIEKLEVTVN